MLNLGNLEPSLCALGMHHNWDPFFFADMHVSGYASSRLIFGLEKVCHFHHRQVVGFPRDEKAPLEERPTPYRAESKTKASMLTLAVINLDDWSEKIDAKDENVVQVRENSLVILTMRHWAMLGRRKVGSASPLRRTKPEFTALILAAMVRRREYRTGLLRHARRFPGLACDERRVGMRLYREERIQTLRKDWIVKRCRQVTAVTEAKCKIGDNKCPTLAYG